MPRVRRARTSAAPSLVAPHRSARRDTVVTEHTADWTTRWPFTTPEGSEARMFIQWKGTDVCLDFYCPCGAHSHLDDSFAYFVECPHCGAVFEMGTQVIAKRTTSPHGRPKVMEPDEAMPPRVLPPEGADDA
jgi:hypothetical protein